MDWDEARGVGLNQVHDIYNFPEKGFLTCQEIHGKYGESIDIIMCAKLLKSIPYWWKVLLNNNVMGDETPTGNSLIPEGMKTSHYMYWKLIEQQVIFTPG